MKSLLAALLLCSASLAFAHCPNAVVCEMKAIDSSVGTVKLLMRSLRRSRHFALRAKNSITTVAKAKHLNCCARLER